MNINNNNFIAIFILFVIILIIMMHYDTLFNNLTYVKSKIDGNKYLVRNVEDKQNAANLIGRINKKILILIEYLKKKKPDDKRTKRLINLYRPSSLSESSASEIFTSYSINKGQKIVLCIRSKKTGKLVDFNTILFVALHEIAHVATKKVGHVSEFWNTFKYLLTVAIKLKIYNYVDYSKKPKKYCGERITDSIL